MTKADEKIDLESLMEDSLSCEWDEGNHRDFGVTCSGDASYMVSACFGDEIICTNLGKRISGHMHQITCSVCHSKAEVCGSVRPI